MKTGLFYILAFFLAVTAMAGDSLTVPQTDSASPVFFRHLIASGALDGAALEYARLRYLGSADTLGFAGTLGNALLAAGNAQKAEALFEEAVEVAETADEKAYAISGLMRAYLMNRKPALARSELDGLDSAVRVQMGGDAMTYFSGLAHASAYRVDSARVWLNKVSTGSSHAANAARVDSLFAWYRSHKMKNPLSAYLYSSAIPGWGHWYVGDRKKAIASFALMAGLSGLLCYEGYRFYRGDSQERYVRGMDMFLVWGLAWRRYYGGIRKAAHQRAAEKNRNVQLEYQERLRRILGQE